MPSIYLLEVVHASLGGLLVTVGVELVGILRPTSMVVLVVVSTAARWLFDGAWRQLLGLSDRGVDLDTWCTDGCSFDALVAHLRDGVIVTLHIGLLQLLVGAMVPHLSVVALEGG